MSKFSLPKMEHRFSIQVVGDESGMNWTGDFLYRRPTLFERSQIDVMRVKLNGDQTTLKDEVARFNEAAAHLRYTVKEFPEWWKDSDMGGSLYDANVIDAIYQKCTEFEAEWSKKLQGGKASDVEVGGEKPSISSEGSSPK